LFRGVVFKISKEETIQLVVKHTELVRRLTEECTERHGAVFRYEYNPEASSQTEPEFSVEICDAVKRVWGEAGTETLSNIYRLRLKYGACLLGHYPHHIDLYVRRWNISTSIQQREKILISIQ
jgi:2-isopropylmalate synthase